VLYLRNELTKRDAAMERLRQEKERLRQERTRESEIKNEQIRQLESSNQVWNKELRLWH
jgi:hypothetical protein